MLSSVLVFLWGVLFLTFPFLMATNTTDAFLLPKEIGVTIVVLLSLLLLGTKMIVSEKVSFRRTPFDLPVLVFLLALVFSSLFAVNRIDSLITTIPVLLAGLGYFILVNVLKKDNAIVFAVATLLVGGAAVSLLAVFSYLKVYPLLFPFTHTPTFTPLGSLLEQAFYLLFLLPVGVLLALPLFKGKTNNLTVTFSVLTILIAAGLCVTLLQLVTTQQPVLLPFEVGFQTAFAAISQDSGRILQGFLFGSGFGNFSVVFTRFKQATFNSSPLWANGFNNSSSFLLELLATTGVLGMLAYLFLLFRVLQMPKKKKTNPLYFGILFAAVISMLYPFAFIEIATFFVLLALFAAMQSKKEEKNYYDVELKFVALKKGMISLQQISVPSHEKHEYNKPMAFTLTGVFLLIVGLVVWYGGSYVLSNLAFAQAISLAQANNGTGAYKYEIQAITYFPYQSVYYRIFSQTNIALANALANVQPKNTKPSTQATNTIYTLLQQGITAAKTATDLSPQTVANWQNLASVYRALLGVGQNADSFAIQASQQAIILDPNNPQEYLALGGLYYQLNNWDSAIQMFQQAITLKPDYANAYYNLGYAYEQKGDNTDALSALQTVKSLVGTDAQNAATVNTDIKNLQSKMSSQNQAVPTVTPQITHPTPEPTAQQKLNLSSQEPVAGEAATPTTSPAPALQ